MRDPLDARLSQLATRTEALAASTGFAERVVTRVAIGEPWVAPLLRSARLCIPVAVVVATLSVAWAYGSQRSLEESLAVALGAEAYGTLGGGY